MLEQRIADKIMNLNLSLNYHLGDVRDIDRGSNQDIVKMIDLKVLATIIVFPCFFYTCYSYVSFFLSALNLFSFSINNAGISR